MVTFVPAMIRVPSFGIGQLISGSASLKVPNNIQFVDELRWTNQPATMATDGPLFAGSDFLRTNFRNDSILLHRNVCFVCFFRRKLAERAKTGVSSSDPFRGALFFPIAARKLSLSTFHFSYYGNRTAGEMADWNVRSSLVQYCRRNKIWNIFFQKFVKIGWKLWTLQFFKVKPDSK